MFPCVAQDGTALMTEKILQERFLQYHRTRYPEKVFLLLDRNLYVAGESVRFAVYCLGPPGTGPSVASSVASVELMDPSGRALWQKKIPLEDGMGWGSFRIPDSFPGGELIIRGYTSWQRNLGPEHYAYSRLLIGNPGEPMLFRDRSMAPPSTVHLEFFPEGGPLIPDVKNRLVFSARDPHGMPVEFRGSLCRSDSAELALLHTPFKGMGSLELIPRPGETYLILPEREYPVEVVIHWPRQEERGCAVRMERVPGGNLQFIIRPGPALRRNTRGIMAMVWSESGIHLIRRLECDTIGRLHVDSQRLSHGIHHLTLLGPQNRILAERSFAVNPSPALQIRTGSVERSYVPGDTIQMDLQLQDHKGSAIPGRISATSVPIGTRNSGSIYQSISWQMLYTPLLTAIPELSMESLSDALTDLLLVSKSKGVSNWITEPPVNPSFLPETQGVIVSGQLLEIPSRQPVPDATLLLSFVDTVTELHVATTSQDGRFWFTPGHPTGVKDMVIQPLNMTKGVLIELEPAFASDTLPDLIWEPVPEERLRQQMDRLFMTRAINREYDLSHSTTIKHHPSVHSLWGAYDHRIILDEYIRLPVMEEVFRELGKRVFLEREDKGYRIQLLDLETNRIIGSDPFFFMDGIPFQSSEALLSMDPLQLYDIRLKSTRYFIQDIPMDGIIEIRSLSGKAGPLPPARSAVRSYLTGFPDEEILLRTDSAAARDIRMPLLMNTLLWEPGLEYHPGKPCGVQFSVPDRKGTYEIILTGMGSGGSVGEKRLVFEVE